MSCRFIARDQPRVIANRHADPCEIGEGCRGCQPCEEPHCRVCNRAHHEHTCAECLAASRDDLREIARMFGALPAEVEHRGVDGEAMVLLAPAADPEAWGHHEASQIAGRIDWLEASDGLHPQTVLGTWEDVWREHLEAPTTLRWTLPRSVDFLDRNLHAMSAEPHVPFEDFARDARRCRAHLEAVLHDGEQRDTGAPCMTCRVPLVREWGRLVAADGWRCPRCHEFSSDDQYRFAVMHVHREEATHLTDRDIELRTGVRAGTVRVWANRGKVERRRDQGRVVYSVTDVMKMANLAH